MTAPGYPPYAYAVPPREPTNMMVSAGGVLAAIGGLIIGIGWLLPIDTFWVVVGIGWLFFGPGLGIALIGLAKPRP